MNILYKLKFLSGCLFFLFFLSTDYVLGYKQSPEGENNDLPNIDQLTNIPNSPEATAFTKYGSIPVSLYTGTPNIGIPIHNIQGRSISVPISLSYDASGIKVEQIATSAGIGWNLNVGGVVTRQTHGLPDDAIRVIPTVYTPHYLYEDFNLFKDLALVPGLDYPKDKARDFLHNIYDETAKGYVDTQPDIFSFNVNGLSGSVYIDYDSGMGYCLEHPELYIYPTFTISQATKASIGVANPNGDWHKVIASWTIVDTQGNKYLFDKAEVTHTETSGNNMPEVEERSFNSAWYLSQITTANNRDVVTFKYSTPVEWTNPQLAKRGESRKQALNTHAWCASTSSESMPTVYKIEQFDLDTIIINGHVAATFSSSTERKDLNGKKALNKITILNEEGSVVKNYELIHSYFGDTTGNATDKESKLRLDALKYYGDNIDLNTPQIHTFEYYDIGTFPSRESFDQDFWGYYNRKNNPETLIPYMEEYDENQTDDFVGANREPSLQFAKIGSLKKLTYPTGGFTEFTYGLNGIAVDPTESSHYTTDPIVGTSFSGATDDPQGHDVSCYDGYTGQPNLKGIEGSFTMQESGEIMINYLVKDNVPGHFIEDSYFFIAIYKTTTSGETIPFCVPGTSDGVFDHGNNSFMDSGNEAVSINQTVFLEAGSYSYLLLNSDPKTTSSIAIAKIILEDIPGAGSTKDVGGLRINKVISQSEANSNNPITKYYFYDDLSKYNLVDDVSVSESGNEVEYEWGANFFENNYFSSGILHRPIIFTSEYVDEKRSTQDKPSFPDWCSNYIMRNGSNLAASSGPDVAYSTVTEISFSNNERVGYTVHEFNNQGHGTIGLGIPYLSKNLKNGNVLKSRVYKYQNEEDKLVQKTETEYTQHYLSHITGYATQNTGRILQSIRFVGRDTDTSIEGYEKEYFTFADLPFASTLHGGPLEGCGKPLEGEFSCIGGPVSVINKKDFYITQYWLTKDKETSTSYFDNGDIVSTSSKFYYENQDHYQITKTETTDSKGKTFISKFKYPHDFEENDLYKKMKENWMIATVIEKENQISNNGTVKTLSKSKTNFLVDGNRVFPESIELTPDGITTEKRATYHHYDDFGNILEYSLESGVHSSFIWGYENTVPIAKVVNAGKDDIAYSSFEKNENQISGNWIYNPNEIVDDENAVTGKKVFQLYYIEEPQSGGPGIGSQITKSNLNPLLKYKVSFWAKGVEAVKVNDIEIPVTDSWKYFEIPITGETSITIETAITVDGNTISIDELRVYPEGALMTTYTYKPKVGVNSICDPNNVVTYYDYDEFGRAEFIYDANRNIVKRFEYKYGQ